MSPRGFKGRFCAEDVQDALEAKREMRRVYGEGIERHAERVRGQAVRVAHAAARAGVHLHAVGVGRKLTDGKAQDVVCVRFYVTQKIAKQHLAESVRLPEKIAGIPTDVIAAPRAYFASPIHPCSAQRTRERRPVQPGTSGASELVNGGTLGALCRSRRAGEAGLQLILSNSHVFAAFGDAAAGAAILQPSPRDGGLAAARIGGLLRSIDIVEGSAAANRVDAAVASLDAGIAATAEICSIGRIQGTAAPAEGMNVHKHGRTSGYTNGVIDDVSCDFSLPISRQQPGRVANFTGQVRIVPKAGASLFAQGGDSGSLVLTKPGNLAVGLVFACPDSSSFAYANPIQDVLHALEIDLL